MNNLNRDNKMYARVSGFLTQKVKPFLDGVVSRSSRTMEMERKENNLLALDASSPEHLNSSLAASLKGEDIRSRSAALSIRDPKVIIRPFHLKDVVLKDVPHHLLSEAVELMSMGSDEIELDFQITKSDQDNVRGVYACIPKKVLEEFLRVLDKKNINPVKVTERFLTRIDWLYQKSMLNGARVCFLDFSPKDAVNVFISSNRECEMIRKIPFENLEEARTEITQSLRSASAKSWLKHYDGIYYAGDLEGTDKILGELKDRFHTSVEKFSDINDAEASDSESTYFGLNLLKNYIFSPLERKYVYMGMNILLGLCLLNIAVLGLRIVMKEKAISEVRSSYQASDYKYAMDLKQSIK